MMRAPRSACMGPVWRSTLRSQRRSPTPSSHVSRLDTLVWDWNWSSRACSWAGSCVELRQPPLEEAPFGVVVDQGQGSVIGLAGLLRAPETPQQLAARRVQVVVVLQGEAVDDLQAR